LIDAFAHKNVQKSYNALNELPTELTVSGGLPVITGHTVHRSNFFRLQQYNIAGDVGAEWVQYDLLK